MLRPAPSETPQRRPDPDILFTDRERERQTLSEVLSTEPTPYDHPEWFLTTFYGVGGVGKSALAGMARGIALEHPDVTLVTVDFDTSGWAIDSPWITVAGELVHALAKAGATPKLSTVLLALHDLYIWPRGDGVGSRMDELGLEVLDKGIEFTQGVPALGVALKWGKWFYDRAQRKQAEFIVQDLGLWPAERGVGIDLQDLERKIAMALFEDLRGFLNVNPQRHVRLLVDGFERLQSYDRRVDAQMHVQDLLGYCAASPDRQAFDRLRVVVFSREKLRWDRLYDAPDWQQCWRQFRLQGLAEPDARGYLLAWRRWFERRDQDLLARALANAEDDILQASDEGEAEDRAFSPFYLTLAVNLVERAVGAGGAPDFGRTPADLQDRFLRHLARGECRALMVLALAEVFDEALFDWLAEHRVIDFAAHSFHSALRQDHSYFQETTLGTWRFHRLFEQALQSRWTTDEAARQECGVVIRRLLDYFATPLLLTPERDWTDAHVQKWSAGMEVLTSQGLEAELLPYEEWRRIATAPPWSTDSFRCRVTGAMVLRRIVVVQERRKGREHVDTLRSAYDLARLLQAQGQWAAAEPLARRVLAGFERVAGAEHPDTFASANTLALLLLARGDWASAEPLFRRALAGYEQALGADHPETLACVASLTLLCQAQGLWAEADQLARRALAGYERIFGADHLFTLVGVTNLALILQAQGAWAAAEPLFRRALAGNERVLAADHPETLRSVNNLALLLRDRGAWIAAEPLARRALAGWEQVLGTDHPDTLTSINNLALIVEAQGDLSAAELLYRRALAGCERALGVDHPDTLMSANNLASLLRSQGEWVAADALVRRALSGCERVLGADHPHTLACVNNLALLLQAQGAQAAAEPLARRALAVSERVLAPDHPVTLTYVYNLAILLQAQGEWAAAEPLIHRALVGYPRVFGADHPQALEAVEVLGSLLRAKGKALGNQSDLASEGRSTS